MQRNASEKEIERDETRKEGKDVQRLLGELACWMCLMLEERERV